MCSDEEVSKMINFLTLEHPDFASHPLESFCMKQAANQHARAEFTIRLDADKWNNRLAQQLYNSEQGICTQDGTIIFRGILEDIEIIRQHGYVLFHGTLISGSVLLDTRPRCRSFQNPNMTWGQILETVIQEYPHGTLLKNCVDYDKSIGRPIIQYQETDWEFLNRIASRCQACIYPDISQPWARCSLGIPLSRKDSFVISPTVYTRTMSRSFYQEGAGSKYGWKEAGGSLNNYIFDNAGFAVNEVPMKEFTDKEWDSVSSYSDAAIMVVSRVCGEGKDLPVSGAADANGNVLGGNNKIAIKVGDRTVLTTTTTDGVLNAKFTLPYLPAGTINVKVTLGENYRYNMLIFNTTATIYKQNVTVTINSIKAKAGSKITLKAKLTNSETKTNVISGKYIFKVNGKTVPLIQNGKEVSTTKIVSDGIAQWDYTLPTNLKAGTYEILVAYNGNTQSNSIKYSSKALTITA